MGSFSLTGQDTLIIDDRVLTDIADGDWCTVTFEQDLANVITGKDGNSIFASNSMGLQAVVTIRVLRASPDDAYLDSREQEQLQDFSAFETLGARFVKRVGDGQGNVVGDQYQGTGGVFQRQVDAKSNAQGDTEQSVSVYRTVFANIQRVIS